ncbi:prenyltransferase [bacterium]|jgi:4-hydroxybenzoate polyprenyltransferase|nr:UbiA family prenyltransferase [Pirellulales bacterium]NBP79251.1 prenyltransferase [bacterium]
MTTASASPQSGSLITWIRLLRLPNHATAVADVLAGWLLIARPETVGVPPAGFWAAAVASLLLYAAGMVLNDVFDQDIDAVERPERPLPSGQIAPAAAALVGWLAAAGGVAAGVIAAVLTGRAAVAVVVVALATAVYLYDRYAKSTAAGPFVMGSCRSLNWLLGMTAAGGPTVVAEALPAAGMGIYVAGITLYARFEATQSSRRWLSMSATVMALGLLTASGYAVWLVGQGGSAWLARAGLENWLLLWGVLAASVLYRAVLGIITPVPALVQRAVGNAIMTIITLDAALVLAACGESWAIIGFMLLLPFLIGRRLVPPT